MPKPSKKSSKPEQHIHLGCAMCQDFAGVCDLHPDCETCLQLDLGNAFTLANLKRECKKSMDEAQYERTNRKDWEARFKRQVVLTTEAETSAKHHESQFKAQVIISKRAFAKIERMQEAYRRACAETAHFKQQCYELKGQLREQGKSFQVLKADSAKIARNQAELNRNQEELNHNLQDTIHNMMAVSYDPSANLMSLFEATTSEFEASK